MIFKFCLFKALIVDRYDFEDVNGMKYGFCVDIIEDEVINQKVLLLTVNVQLPENGIMYFGFGVCEDFDIIQMNIQHYKGAVLNEIHASYVESIDDLEARLFQIETLVDVYDLDVSLFDTMLNLRDVYFNNKNETVLENMV